MLVKLLTDREFLEQYEAFYEDLADEFSKSQLLKFLKIHIYSAFLEYENWPEKIDPALCKNEVNKFYETYYRDGVLRWKDYAFTIPCCPTFAHLAIGYQYVYKDEVFPEREMHILDIGAFVGDSSIWFHDYLKDSGVIYAIEADEYWFNLLRSNIEVNQISNIISMLYLLSDRVSDSTLTLDYLVEREKIERVDYIKMDIEGAERKVLFGAFNTLKSMYPQLAISVYHLYDDIPVIYSYLKKIGYNTFYFKHSSSWWKEWIMFVKKDKY